MNIRLVNHCELMCALLSLMHNGSHSPPGPKVMSYGGRSNNSDIWWYCRVGFLCLTSTGNSFHIQDILASLLTLQPHSSCSFSDSELKTRNPGGRSGIWIMESSSGGLKSELSWSLGLSWVSSNCNVEILLEFLCCWLFYPCTFSLPAPKKHDRVAGSPVMTTM